MGWTPDGRLWILESTTAGGKRIAIIAARRISEGKERIDLILSAIQRAHINVVSTQTIGWPHARR